MEYLLERHSGEVLILVLSAMVLGTVLVIVPQLLRARMRAREIEHTETLKALEKGHPPRPYDTTAVAAGRTAVLVPIFAVCTAGTVTCFLAAYRTEQLFAVALAVWSVAGLLGLAAATGGVALMSRLANLPVYDDEDDESGATGRDRPLTGPPPPQDPG
jgi:hypothetical protein